MANHEQLNRLIVSVKDNNRCKSWNDWIRDNKLLDMSRLDLSRTYLSRFHLLKVDLSEVDLYQINLAEANLAEVNLSKSNLFFTNLFHANLFRANLSCAKWSGGVKIWSKKLNWKSGQGVGLVKKKNKPNYLLFSFV